MKEFDVCIIGGSLAGLGCAIPLANKYKQKVVVFERTTPKFDGKDRFRHTNASGFKNAGIVRLGLLRDIRQFFTEETERIYRQLGVNVKECNAVQPTTSRIDDRVLYVSDIMTEVQDQQTTKYFDVPSNKGVYHFPSADKSTNVEPESAMKALYQNARKSKNLNLNFGKRVTDIQRKEHSWLITAGNELTKAKHLIIAAGPGSQEMCNLIGVHLPVKHIYGIMGESQQTDQIDMYRGIVIASDAEIKWLFQDALERLCCGWWRKSIIQERSHCTAIMNNHGRVYHMYRHLYGACQIRNGHERFCLGGPRIQLPQGWTIEDQDTLRPSMFANEWNITKAYLFKLMKLPALVFKHLWGGTMCFPEDEQGPFVGTIPKVFNEHLHLCTGFESSGFRQAVGAGQFLADGIIHGWEWIEKEHASDIVRKHWKDVQPSSARRVSVCLKTIKH